MNFFPFFVICVVLFPVAITDGSVDMLDKFTRLKSQSPANQNNLDHDLSYEKMDLSDYKADLLFNNKNMEQQNNYRSVINNSSEAHAYVQWVNPFGNLYFVSNFEESHNLGKNGGVMSCATNTSTIIVNVINVEGKIQSYIQNFIETFPAKEFRNLNSITMTTIVYIQDEDIKAGPLINPSDEDYNQHLDLNFHTTRCNIISENKDMSYLSFKYSDLQEPADLISPILMYIEFFKPNLMGHINSKKDDINIVCENPITHKITQYYNNELEISLKNYPNERVEVILDCINLQSMIRNQKYSSKCETSFLFNNEVNKQIPDDNDICHFLVNANGDSVDYYNSEYYNYNILSDVKIENKNDNNEVQLISKDNRDVIIVDDNLTPSLLEDVINSNRFEISYKNKISKESKMIILRKFQENFVYTLYGLKKDDNYKNGNDNNKNYTNVLSKYENLGKYRINSHLHLLTYEISKLDKNNCPDVNIFGDINNSLPFNLHYSHYLIEFSNNQKDLFCKLNNESDEDSLDEE